MSASPAPRLDVTAAPRAVTLPCARKWPRALDGRSLRPVRGTWHPMLVRPTEEDAPHLVPLLSCPRCSEPIMLVLDADAARVLQAKARPGHAVVPTHTVDERGVVSPEPRCGCGWYGPATLAEWNQWQTLYCAMVLEGSNPQMRALYVHAADVVHAQHAVSRPGRRIVSTSAVIRNDRERLVLP